MSFLQELNLVKHHAHGARRSNVVQLACADSNTGNLTTFYLPPNTQFICENGTMYIPSEGDDIPSGTSVLHQNGTTFVPAPTKRPTSGAAQIGVDKWAVCLALLVVSSAVLTS